MISAIIEFVNQVLGTLLFFLPDSPFTEFIKEVESWEWLGWLNWFLPIGTFLEILYVWAGCVSAYYVYSIVLRWIKAVQ